MMPYERKCERCGAMLDPGEVCRCDTENGSRVPSYAVPGKIVAAQGATRAETARLLDAAVWRASMRYREEKRRKRGRRR